MKPGKFLCLVSNVVPIRIKKIRTSRRKSLELFLHKKQFKLQYGKVLYSDGNEYFPFKLGFGAIEKQLPQYNDVLVLGAGIGSIGMILQDQFPDQKWNIEFVDNSKPVIDICSFVMDLYSNIKAEYVCADALDFVTSSRKKYDLICVDIFNENIVPEKFLSQGFLHLLRPLLNQQFSLVMNTMFQTKLQQDIFESVLEQAFPQFKTITEYRNFIYIISNQ